MGLAWFHASYQVCLTVGQRAELIPDIPNVLTFSPPSPQNVTAVTTCRHKVLVEYKDKNSFQCAGARQELQESTLALHAAHPGGCTPAILDYRPGYLS